MGYLLALALQDFSLSTFFTSLKSSVPSTVKIDSRIGQTEHRFGKIRFPQVILMMLHLVKEMPQDDTMMRYAVMKLTERLASANHRNQALLNEIGVVRFTFNKLFTPQTQQIDDSERAVLQRLLRRLLEMGASTEDAREVYQRALKDDPSIDTEVLEVLKSCQRAKWPEHLSFDGTGVLELKEDGGKGFPCPNGFTFMVRMFQNL